MATHSLSLPLPPSVLPSLHRATLNPALTRNWISPRRVGKVDPSLVVGRVEGVHEATNPPLLLLPSRKWSVEVE